MERLAICEVASDFVVYKQTSKERVQDQIDKENNKLPNVDKKDIGV